MDFTPRRWWVGSLDVERLAWSSVDAARRAAQAVVDVRGPDVRAGSEPALVAASFAAIEHLRIEGREPQGWAPLSGFFAAADGWVRLHANYPHHAAAITRALGGDTRDALVQAVAERRAIDVETAVTDERGIAVAVRSPAEWLSTAHGSATASEPWSSVEMHGRRNPLSANPVRVLDGVRVLDLTRVIAGPSCSQLLACLGADVLRIDPPGRPELLDQYLSNGMGKRSAAVDLAPAGSAVEALLRGADVVLLGYRPGVLARFGLDPDELLDRHPHLIVASMSAWGEQGSWAQRPGFDSIVQAACGIAVTCGSDEKPGALPVQALDHSSGYLMAAHVMELLAAGRAGVARVSLLGAARTLLAYGPPPAETVAELPVRRVRLASPHGVLDAVPPPLTLDGATIEQPVTRYSGAVSAWL